MFGFVQYDSPLLLLLEVGLAAVVFAVAFIIARRVEQRQSPGAGAPQVQTLDQCSNDQPADALPGRPESSAK